MATNDFLPFSYDGAALTYTNAEYLAHPQRPIGNQIGIADPKLVNKVLRQTSSIAAALAQFIVDRTGESMLDDGNDVTLLARLKLANPIFGKNLIINSNGLVNQRSYISGTATTGANQYTLDMFRVVISGQSLTFTTTAGVTVFTAPSGGVDLPIENKNIIGGSYVLSFAGTATVVVSQSSDNITYTTITPVAGVYTITGGYYVRVRFLGGTFSAPKFEEGVIVTPYSLPNFSDELTQCQRYYQSYGFNAAFTWQSEGMYANAGGVLIGYTCPIATEMRAAPTGTIIGTWTVSNCSQPSIGGISSKTVEIRATSISAGMMLYRSTVSSGFILSAEL